MTEAASPAGPEILRDMHMAGRVLADYRPRRNLVRRWLHRSAVGLYLSDHLGGDISVLMIKRAEREGDPWSGHMAFPGGRKDKGDRNTLVTAKRETREEVALDADEHATLLGRLSDVTASARARSINMIVTPYVFRLRTLPELAPNYEVDEVVWVPLSWLADRSNRQKMKWAPNGIPLELPCYLFNERRIWGLSLMMLDELLDALL